MISNTLCLSACNRLLLNQLDESEISTEVDKKLTCIDTNKELRYARLRSDSSEKANSTSLDGFNIIMNSLCSLSYLSQASIV